MFLNAFVGFMQEFKAEKTMESLRKMASPTSTVIRSGKEQSVPTRELVVGDIIILKSGDVVGADCRIIEYVYCFIVFQLYLTCIYSRASNMDVDEALLTGESVPVNKNPETLPNAEVSLGDRVNMSYSSTTLAKGRGKGKLSTHIILLYCIILTCQHHSHNHCHWYGNRDWSYCSAFDG